MACLSVCLSSPALAASSTGPEPAPVAVAAVCPMKAPPNVTRRVPRLLEVDNLSALCAPISLSLQREITISATSFTSLPKMLIILLARVKLREVYGWGAVTTAASLAAETVLAGS